MPNSGKKFNNDMLCNMYAEISNCIKVYETAPNTLIPTVLKYFLNNLIEKNIIETLTSPDKKLYKKVMGFPKIKTNRIDFKIEINKVAL